VRCASVHVPQIAMVGVDVRRLSCLLDEDLWPKMRMQLIHVLQSVVESELLHSIQSGAAENEANDLGVRGAATKLLEHQLHSIEKDTNNLDSREAALKLLEHQLQLAHSKLQTDRLALEAEMEADRGDMVKALQADQQELHSELVALEADRAILQADRANFDGELQAQRLVMQEQLQADRSAMEAELQAERESLQFEFATLEEELREKLAVQEERLQADRRALEKEKDTVFCGADMSDILKLNVGGLKTLAVQRSTLCAIEGSMLASSFSGRWDSSLPRDEDGAFFIDFDPELFLPLLEYLRLQGARRRPAEEQMMPQVQGREDEFAAMLNYYCIGITSADVESLVFKFAQPEVQGVSVSTCGQIATRTALPHWKRAFGDVLLNRTLLKKPVRIAFRTLAFGNSMDDECGPHVGICDANVSRADDHDEVRKPEGMYTFRPSNGLLLAPASAHIVGPNPRVAVKPGEVTAFVVHPDGQATLEINGKSLGTVFRCLPEVIKPVVEMNCDPSRVEIY